jgi:hypothetical protein
LFTSIKEARGRQTVKPGALGCHPGFECFGIVNRKAVEEISSQIPDCRVGTFCYSIQKAFDVYV